MILFSLFIVLTSILLGLTVLDLFRVFGPRQGGLYLAAGTVFAALKEHGNAVEANPQYRFLLPKTLTFWNVSLVAVVGWVIVFCLGICWAERRHGPGNRMIRYAARSALVAFLISLAVEPAAVAAGWWQWRSDENHLLMWPIFWAGVSFIFNSFYLMAVRCGEKGRIWFAVSIVLWAFMQFSGYGLDRYAHLFVILLFLVAGTLLRINPLSAGRETTV